MVLWCRAGRGTIWVDGAEITLPPGTFCVLPWGVSIRYLAARQKPFLLGGAHLIPRLRGAFQPGVAHAPGQAHFGSPDRADNPALSPILFHGRGEDYPAILSLLEHLAQTWQQHPPSAALARAQGMMLEASLLPLRERAEVQTFPENIRVLQQAVQRNLDYAWDLQQLAKTAHCSTAWLNRQFRQHIRTSPCRWLQNIRLEHARKLLVSTALPVADIAAQCGFPDRRQFSKAYQAYFDLSPRAWRRVHAWI